MRNNVRLDCIKVLKILFKLVFSFHEKNIQPSCTHVAYIETLLLNKGITITATRNQINIKI